MSTQLKFVVEDSLAERFKKAVLEKHGKMELSKEGEEALRLYLRERGRSARAAEREPLLDIIGMFSSKAGADALKDKKALRRTLKVKGRRRGG